MKTGAGENTDSTTVLIGVIARIFQCFPRTFQKDSMLRIRYFCFSWREAEKFSIEVFDSIQNWTCFYIMVGGEQAGIHTRCQEVSVVQPGNGLYSVAKIAPELFQIGCTREPPCQTNNCNVIELFLLHDE